jgi:hypothetical protein
MSIRTKVTIAGAIIAAIADLLLILLIGWHSDDHTHHNRTVHEEIPGGWACACQVCAWAEEGVRCSPCPICFAAGALRLRSAAEPYPLPPSVLLQAMPPPLSL